MRPVAQIEVPIKTAARAFYLAYLNSPEWRARRNEALKAAKYRCSQCGAKRDLQVHHRTYERLGREPLEDLAVLCFTCHNGEHIRLAEDTSLGLYLKIAGEALRLHPFTRIADLSEDVKLLCAKYKIPNKPELIAKAIRLVCYSRENIRNHGQTKPYVSVVEEQNDRLSHAQSVEFLQRLGIAEIADRVVRRMPEARVPTVRQTERLRALKLIAAAIADSVQRCEELEAQESV